MMYCNGFGLVVMPVCSPSSSVTGGALSFTGAVAVSDTRTTLDRLDERARVAAEHRRLAERAGEWADYAWFTDELDKILEQRFREAAR